jgi:hypothetical protein
VLLVEAVVGPPNEDPSVKFLDLMMLVSAGGQERTEEEYAALFAAGGFRLVGVTPTAAGMSILEAAPV